MENKLSTETSLYLQQHATNPVHWQAWSESAFAQARAENKIVLLSIGYSSCHWCHVMEHESFENDTVAKAMNKHFICIKIDREEHPEVDSLYMQALQIMGQHGGWPLNVFCLPNGKPFYGGTYFPKENWLQVLQNINTLHQTKPDKLIDYAKRISDGYAVLDQQFEPQEQKVEVNTFFTALEKRYDKTLGGLYGAPKFPMPILWQNLASLSLLYKNKDLSNKVENTVLNIINGGIYDQIGGGISRYSVDEFWKVPHFEKMLYDNAQFIGLLAQVYQSSKKTYFKQATYQTIAFLEKEFKSDKLYYAALDADTEGEEGKYYVWTLESLQSYLSPTEFELANTSFSLKERGYWEHGNYVLQGSWNKEFAELDDLKKKLLALREQRIKPALDDKQIISWNALLGTNFIKCAIAFTDNTLLEKAKNIYQNIISLSKEMGGLMHHYKVVVKANEALLEDYVFFQELCIQLYIETSEETYLTKAISLMESIVAKFSSNKGLFFSSAENELLIKRTFDTLDSVIPSANSTLACNAFILFQATGDVTYYSIWQKIINHYDWASQPLHHANWYKAYELQNIPFIRLYGKNAQAWKKQLSETYSGSLISFAATNKMAQKMPSSDSMALICKEKACSAPITSFENLIDELNA